MQVRRSQIYEISSYRKLYSKADSMTNFKNTLKKMPIVDFFKNQGEFLSQT